LFKIIEGGSDANFFRGLQVNGKIQDVNRCARGYDGKTL